MRTAAVLGGIDLHDAVTALGLEDVADRPEVVVVDADDDGAIERAAGFDGVPRIFVASSSFGGGTFTDWKRRSNERSFSIDLRNSAGVVAPIH